MKAAASIGGEERRRDIELPRTPAHNWPPSKDTWDINNHRRGMLAINKWALLGRNAPVCIKGIGPEKLEKKLTERHH